MPHPTRIFKEPEDLLKAWTLYKGSLIEEAKKWPKIQYVGKDGTRKEDYPKLPLTLDSFEVWAYDRYGCIDQYFKNQDKRFNDFIPLCSRIRKECRADQLTGGLLNIYNTSITQRLNNLAEQTKDVTPQQIIVESGSDTEAKKNQETLDNLEE